jgi:hypothetical protein
MPNTCDLLPILSTQRDAEQAAEPVEVQAKKSAIPMALNYCSTTVSRHPMVGEMLKGVRCGETFGSSIRAYRRESLIPREMLLFFKYCANIFWKCSISENCQVIVYCGMNSMLGSPMQLFLLVTSKRRPASRYVGLPCSFNLKWFYHKHNVFFYFAVR